LRCVDAAAQEKMKAEVDAVLKAGDTVGGSFRSRSRTTSPSVLVHMRSGTKNSTAASRKP
jgi:chorismate synthase